MTQVTQDIAVRLRKISMTRQWFLKVIYIMIASITWFKLRSAFSQAYHSDCSVTGPINQFISDHFTRPVSFGSWSKMCEHRSVLYCTLTENKIMFYGVTVRSSKGICYFKQDSRFYPVQFSDQLSTVIYLSVVYVHHSFQPEWFLSHLTTKQLT